MMNPIIHEKDKRLIAAYLPYRKAGETYEFYLQMRSATARNNPNVFGLFGGGVEDGETIEQGFMREIFEELVYVPQSYRYVTRYETASSVLHLFIEEIDYDYELNIEIREGEYGRFVSYEESQDIKNISPLARVMIFDVRNKVLK